MEPNTKINKNVYEQIKPMKDYFRCVLAIRKSVCQSVHLTVHHAFVEEMFEDS